MVNGIPAASKLIKSKGGPNGKYGPATTAVISTLQKMVGNKNTSGELDKALLDDIVASDWVSEKDKKAIQKSLEIVRNKMNESSSPIISLSDFRKLYEGKIVINNSDFEKELNTQYKNIGGTVGTRSAKGETHESPGRGGSSSGVKSLAKNLRSAYNLKVEEEDFVKQDGSLKSSYSPQFIKAWNTSLEKLEGKKADEYSYFFFSGGVYNINLASSSLKTPCNWNKWADARGIKTLGNDDATDFVENYIKGWKTFGMVRPGYRYDGIKSLLRANAQNDALDLSTAYEMMETSVKNKSVPFIDYDNLKGDISKAFGLALQRGEKSPDLGKEEFVAINNFLIMIANAVSFDGSKFISCLKWIHDNILGEATAKRIKRDQMFGLSDDDRDTGKLLGFQGSQIIMAGAEKLADKKLNKRGEISEDLPGLRVLSDTKEASPIREVLAKNCYYIGADVYPSIKLHVKRMNATNFEQVPQSAPFKCQEFKA